MSDPNMFDQKDYRVHDGLCCGLCIAMTEILLPR